MDADREVFLRYLREAAARFALRVEAYCLMTNHIHLVVTPEQEDSLAGALKRVDQLYAQYVNRLHGRSGHVWEKPLLFLSAGHQPFGAGLGLCGTQSGACGPVPGGMAMAVEQCRGPLRRRRHLRPAGPGGVVAGGRSREVARSLAAARGAGADPVATAGNQPGSAAGERPFHSQTGDSAGPASSRSASWPAAKGKADGGHGKQVKQQMGCVPGTGIPGHPNCLFCHSQNLLHPLSCDGPGTQGLKSCRAETILMFERVRDMVERGYIAIIGFMRPNGKSKS